MTVSAVSRLRRAVNTALRSLFAPPALRTPADPIPFETLEGRLQVDNPISPGLQVQFFGSVYDPATGETQLSMSSTAFATSTAANVNYAGASVTDSATNTTYDTFRLH